MNMDITYAAMEAMLTNPETRIIDSRMLELSEDFSTTLQVLTQDKNILSCTVAHEMGMQQRLQLFKLQYQNNPRNNPGLYGLLDGVKENVE